MLRPIPWPTYSRTTSNPAPRATCSTAAPMSESRPPGRICEIPASSASSVTRTSLSGSAEADKLVRVTEEALEAGIAQIRPGGRLSDIGAAVEQVARGAGFEVVREYVGHGIGRNMHEDPQIPNYGRPGRGPVLKPGLVVAVEPMVNAGGWETSLLPDGWTVVTEDGSLSAHFEHTIAVTEDGYEVLTARG